MAKKVTMEDIAKKVGMSKNTVSLALRNMPGINAQTRKLIFETAKQLGYEYKKNSSQNSSSDTSYKNICLIFSKDTHKSEGFFSYIQYGVESEAKKIIWTSLYIAMMRTRKSLKHRSVLKKGLFQVLLPLAEYPKNTDFHSKI